MPRLFFDESCAHSRIIGAGTEKKRAEKTAYMVLSGREETVVASDATVSLKQIRAGMSQVERSGQLGE